MLTELLWIFCPTLPCMFLFDDQRMADANLHNQGQWNWFHSLPPGWYACLVKPWEAFRVRASVFFSPPAACHTMPSFMIPRSGNGGRAVVVQVSEGVNLLGKYRFGATWRAVFYVTFWGLMSNPENPLPKKSMNIGIY